MPKYIAKPGDCVTSIAESHGFFWETVWNDGQNGALRKQRKDPNTIQAGDAVFVPDKRPKKAEVSTGRMHRFKKKGVPALFRLQLLENEEYLAGQDYELTIDDGTRRVVHRGRTTSEGVVEASLPPLAQTARLIVGPDRKEYTLKFGFLPPIDEVSGVQARLQNLGFYLGDVSGIADEETKDALLAFQQRFGLEETGEPDDKTKQELTRRHDKQGGYAKSGGGA